MNNENASPYSMKTFETKRPSTTNPSTTINQSYSTLNQTI